MIARATMRDERVLRRTDREVGLVGVDWIIVLPLFLAVVFFLVSIPAWPERRSGAQAAASEGARAAVLETRPGDVEPTARRVAREVLDFYNVPPDAYSIDVDGAFQLGEAITVTVIIELPLIRIPFGPDIASRQEQVTATEDVGLYREIER